MKNAPKVVIVNYGLGNLLSVSNNFRRSGIPSLISDQKEDILNADKLILPGVGHFGKGMANLQERGILDPLNEAVLEKKIPVLGICLGMQLFTDYSEEADAKGLGWIPGKTIRFQFENGSREKNPHIGWNQIQVSGKTDLLSGIQSDEMFYFVHSYYVKCDNKEDVLAETAYGQEFVSAIHRGNVYGTQFHPEKSHDYGSLILKNFIEKI